LDGRFNGIRWIHFMVSGVLFTRMAKTSLGVRDAKVQG
jgi:hypothetical protein